MTGAMTPSGEPELKPAAPSRRAVIPVQPDTSVVVTAISGSGTGAAAPPAATAPAQVAVVVPGADRHLSRIRSAVMVLVAGLGLSVLWRVVQSPAGAIDLLEGAVVAALAVALVSYERVTTAATARRINRDASLNRILHGLSRSVSPESVVDAIVQELRSTSGADHVVVARVRRPDLVVEATLVSSGAAVPPSMTYLRPEVEVRATSVASKAAAPAPEGDASAGAAQTAADEIARRVRSGYGLSNVLALPLVHERHFLGALILSKRTRGAWSDADRRLLTWATTEVSAAFGRAYAHEEAERGANIDPLTGLPNRRYFDELVAILRPGRRSGDRTGIVMVDVDRFKRLNDTYGHATGDVVLKAIAGAITASVRAEDTPARFGGEEFVVILRRASAGQAADVGERIRAAVAALPVGSFGLKEPVTVSVGVAVANEDEEVRSLIERADRALYVAKRRGRDRVEVA